MPDFKLSDEELASGRIFIKSDVYVDDDVPGGCRWVAVHPPSGWTETGTGTTHEDCTQQINARLEQLITAQGHEIGAGASVLRSWYGDEDHEQLIGADLARHWGAKLGPREPIHIDSTLIEAGMFTAIAPGVLGYTVEDDEALFVPFVYALTEGAGDVGRFLDSLPTDKTVVVPNVLSERLAGMLSRRGFKEEPWELSDEDVRSLQEGAESPEVERTIPAYVRRR